MASPQLSLHALTAPCWPAGSGKTLAYLLPLVQRMREEEKSACDSLTLRNCPRVIVLAPTTELCAQARLLLPAGGDSSS